MVALIGQLIATDHAYVTDDGVYLAVESVPDYGLLAHQSAGRHARRRRRPGGPRRGEQAAPDDFVLWKLATGPARAGWPSPWGDGRPGWHSECVVMSLDLLGEGFDLHCGGRTCASRTTRTNAPRPVALGKTFANHWMHNGFVVDAEGEKLSKSLGNVTNLLDLIELYDRRAYRMVLLQSHYRSPVKITQDGIDAAVKSLAGLDAFAAPLPRSRATIQMLSVLDEFRAAMDDDLDTPRATALLFDTVRRANAALDAGDSGAGRLVGAVHEIAGAVGLDFATPVEVDADALGPSPGSRRCPRHEGLCHTPTRCGRNSKPKDGRWRPPATGRRCDGDHDRRQPAVGAGTSARRSIRRTDGPPARVPAMGYQPSLDGLRALSVAVVLLYHAGFSWMHGGFFGVEVFFVVSGYLITSLLLDERDSDGNVSFRHFWPRRARRLFPALYAVLVAVGVGTVLWGSAEQQSQVRREIPWSVFYVNNWGQILGNVPYFAGEPSPLRHPGASQSRSSGT